MLKKSKYTLYEDQEISVTALLDKVQGGEKRILFVGATGSGKTAISAELKRRLHPKKMLFVVHRDILITQTIETLRKTGFPLELIGVIAGRYAENRNAPLQILSIQTAPRRSLDWFKWEIAFFDEAHTTGWSNWALKLQRENKDRPIVYLTATPWRLSKKQSFTDIVPKDNYVFAPLPTELIEKGRLTKPIYYKALEVKLTGVRKQGGDYKVSDLSVLCNNPEVISSGLKFWQERYPNERTVAFAVSVEHAETIVKMANEAGRKAVIVHGETPIPERDRHYKALKDHTIDMIVSVDCLSEGFDVPNIRCAWMLRPTLSKSKFYQQMGRAMRVADGKENCIILDQSGNIGRHSLVENLDKDDFYDSSDVATKEPPPPPICAERDLDTWDIIWNGEGCHAVIRGNPKICPHCGYVLPVRVDNKAIAIGEVVEVTALTQKNLHANPQCLDEKNFFITVMDKTFFMGWHPAAARHRFKDAFNVYPPFDYFWRWTRYRKKTAEQITIYLKGVDIRKKSGDSVEKTWLPKFTPPEDVPQSIEEIWRRITRYDEFEFLNNLVEPKGFKNNTMICKWKSTARPIDMAYGRSARPHFAEKISEICKQLIQVEFVA